MNWHKRFGIACFIWALVGSVFLGSVYLSQATVSSTSPRNDYVGTGAVSVYSYTFRIFAASDLKVTTADTDGTETLLVLNTDYTVTGTNRPAGGTITLLAGALTADYRLTIRFDRVPQQSTDLRNQGDFFAETHEDKFDELTRYIQALRDVVSRSLHLPETEDPADFTMTLPVTSERASKFLAFDAEGNPIATGGGMTSPPVTAFMETLLDDTTAAAARTTLGTDTNNAAINAKGDLLAGTADNVMARVAVSATTGMRLVADPSATAGVSWSFPAMPNPIINGNMDIWQRGTSFPTATSTFTADRWYWANNLVTARQSTNVPTVAQAGVLFNYSLEVDVTTADASLAAGDNYSIKHTIEGYNWRQFAQRDFVMSFWVMATKTGLHAVGVSNSGVDRGYVGTYTVNLADTWEYKTITFPASPSAGTWDYTNGKGLVIHFTLGAGSNHQYTAGSWQTLSGSNSAMATSSTVNDMDSTSNFFRLTGVKMDPGSVATPIQFVPFETELARCKRYYQKSFLYGTAPAQNVGTFTGETIMVSAVTGAVAARFPHIPFNPEVRATTNLTLYSPGAASTHAYNITDSAAHTSTSIDSHTTRGFVVTSIGNAGLAPGEYVGIHWAADGEF